MNKFYKVDYDQYCDAVGGDAVLVNEYNDIRLPHRATALSAGYDFYAPFAFSLEPGEGIKILTGIGVLLDDDKFLGLVPRSGLGFKYRLQLDNTFGVVDADFSGAKNGGHIMAKLTNDGSKRLEIKKGEAFMQGIILPYFKTDDDESTAVRTGGFGSTG